MYLEQILLPGYQGFLRRFALVSRKNRQLDRVGGDVSRPTRSVGTDRGKNAQIVVPTLSVVIYCNIHLKSNKYKQL